VNPHSLCVKGFTLTVIHMHDIRENDVAESAGMSNIPWAYEYGFSRQEDPQDTHGSILDEMYNYGVSEDNETVLDGLSPDANGQFFTNVVVKRAGKEMIVKYSREHLIKLANQILRKAAVDMAYAIQREYLHPGPDLTMRYEICKERGTTKSVVVGDDAYPLNQLLDLRGFSVIGKMDWVDEDVD